MKRADAERLKVLSYNIHKGFTAGNRKHVLHQMRDAIRGINPDLVFLQEVGQFAFKGKKHASAPTEAQFEFLADEVWHHHAYGKNAAYSGGHHGNAILSKFPIISSINIDISSHRFERRGLLHALIEIPATGQKINLLCVHLDLLEIGRRAQIKRICAYVEQQIGKREPVILCGDFNDWRQGISKRLMKELNMGEAFQALYGEHAKTFPSFMPALALDRIYYRAAKPLSAGCLSSHPWEDLSDHLALYADFSLPKI